MFPETGRKLPKHTPALTGAVVSERIGNALRAELGSSRQAAKTVMAWTGVCDKAARIWIAGAGGMSGAHLLQLARYSDTIWRLMLELALRDEAVLGFDILAVEVALSRALGTVEMLKREMVSRLDSA